MVQIDPGADTIQFIGDAALDAAGVGWAAPIWDMFFPADDPVFSEAQMKQLEELFSSLFAQQYYLENLNAFTGSTTSCNEYANNPVPAQLGNLLTDTEQTAQGILSNGYTTARVYLSAASLHILTLKFAYEAATGPDKDGAAKNIAQAAADTLNELVTLEAAYGAAAGWDEFIGFKQATVAGVGNLSAAAAAAFGPTYITQVQDLFGLVNTYDSAQLSQVAYAPYLLQSVPYDAASTPLTWKCWTYNYGTIGMFKCQTQPPGVPSNFYPLSDLATVNQFGGQGDTTTPTNVLYIAAYAKPLTAPTGFNKIYNDHGSGLPQDYAGFLTSPEGVGSYSASNDDASQPDASGLAVLLDSEYYNLVELGSAAWDDSGSGADEDGTVYSHPQFGDYGIYLIVRSHSRPDPDTTPGLTWEAIAGHPKYVPTP